MKKIPVLLLVIMTFISLSAQDSKPTTKSAILIGGGATFGWKAINIDEAEDAINLINFGISPTLGYFIKDKLALGLTPSISFSIRTSEENKVLYLGISPFIKYYFDNGFVLKGSTGYTFGLSKDDNDKEISHLIPVNVGFGYAIFLNSKVSLEIYINDNLFISLQDGNSHTYLQNDLFFSAGLQVFL